MRPDPGERRDLAMKQHLKRAAHALVLSARLYRELALSASALVRRPAN
jgi:hypothetical protein